MNRPSPGEALLSPGQSRHRALWLLLVPALLAGYVAAGAFGELHLARLLDSTPPQNEQPVVYEGIEFGGVRDVQVFEEEERRDRFFPWMRPVPQWSALVLLCVSVGFLGGCTRDVYARTRTSRSRVGLRPVLGALVAAGVLAVLAAVPLALTYGSTGLRPEMVASLGFLSGVFSEEAWKSIRSKTKGLLERA